MSLRHQSKWVYGKHSGQITSGSSLWKRSWNTTIRRAPRKHDSLLHSTFSVSVENVCPVQGAIMPYHPTQQHRTYTTRIKLQEIKLVQSARSIKGSLRRQADRRFSPCKERKAISQGKVLKKHAPNKKIGTPDRSPEILNFTKQ